MLALEGAGQKSNHRFVELRYVVAEQEEDEEARDYSRYSKITTPTLNHSAYSCIGSATCHKQKQVRKLFPITLKQCEENQKLNAEQP